MFCHSIDRRRRRRCRFTPSPHIRLITIIRWLCIDDFNFSSVHTAYSKAFVAFFTPESEIFFDFHHHEKNQQQQHRYNSRIEGILLLLNWQLL